MFFGFDKKLNNTFSRFGDRNHSASYILSSFQKVDETKFPEISMKGEKIDFLKNQ